MAKIVIIGAGWLGLPLAKAIKAQGHEVMVTKQSESDCQHLSDIEGIAAFPFQLGSQLPFALHKADIYIINIAAGRRHIDGELFSANMQVLFQTCLMNPAKLLFISSTSVYGESDRVITETSETDPITDSAIAHVELERWLTQHAQPDTTILRLSGLVGEDRHPVHYLAGKTDITASHKVVNLVHREDVITAIEAIIQQSCWGQILHLCSTEHPTRLQYYKWAAEQLYLAMPEFFDETEQEACGKRIDASHTIATLNLQMQYASPFDMIPGSTHPEKQSG